jgi:YqaJ-like viral recombinase domain
MKIYSEMTQGTPEWRLLRSGKFTASNFDKLFMAKSMAGYQNLVNTVVFERLTGEVSASYQNDAMRRGNELESEALERYELETFSKTTRVGFVERDEWVGCSPDSFIGEKGLVQVKCPLHTTFIYYLLKPDKAKDEYLYQCQGELSVTEREWNDLFLYHPKFEPITIRIERDEKIIKEIEEKLSEAIETTQQRINQIKGVK